MSISEILNISRTEETKISDWYFGIDRKIIVSILLLVCISIITIYSTGSLKAINLGLPSYSLLLKMIPWYFIGLSSLIILSFGNKKFVLTISFANFLVCSILLLITVFHPYVINGSTRWADLGFIKLMPTDLMKPGFIITTAWFLSKMKKTYGQQILWNKDAWKFKALSWLTYFSITLPLLFIIFRHPDVGSFLLYFSVLIAMLFVASMSIFEAIIFSILVFLGGGIGAYLLNMEHIKNRILKFFFEGGTEQTKWSIKTIQNGGLFGKWDKAYVKQHLPDSHTDFIFSATIEDFGAILTCLVILGVYLYILKKLLDNARKARDPFVFYSIVGVLAMFGGQVCINIISALNLFATKGMTLPFISYGGSSFIAYCSMFGLLLAIINEDKWRQL